ncbi:2,3-dihydroxyphenylpropionate/2,3-dihydroxicinnamic acid 1,2-dioxygenase [Candidatus Entotheonellaceae bacterium PAL068K]
MGEILGMASTHWPLLIQPDEGHPWPFQRVMERHPDLPEHVKGQANWPQQAQIEFGEDQGVSAHKEHRARLVQAFRTLKAEIEAFNPDFILMFGDDQYENFKEDIIPPFCVLAYDEFVSYPHKNGFMPGYANVWGESEDHAIIMRGKPDVARWLTRRLLEERVDMAYAYTPLHWNGLGHAFVNIQMYLDYDRKGFDVPVIPVQVNCYGSKVIRNRGGIGSNPNLDADPPSPTPRRCFEVGQTVGRILQESPYRTVVYASGGWSHGFLTEKNHCLWPDIDADRLRLEQLEAGTEAAWKDLSVAEIEDAGQQELLTWVCLAGAMHEVGQKAAIIDYLETHIFNSGKCLAIYKP